MKRILSYLLLTLFFLVSCNDDKLIVSFDPNNGEEIIIKMKDNKIDMPEEPKKEGYRFLGWFYEGQNININDIKSDIVLVAEWEKIIHRYVVSFDSVGGNYILPVEVAELNLIDKPSNPIKDGYEFIGWYCNEKLWDFDNDKVFEDITLTAKWEKVSYYVIFDYNVDAIENDCYYIYNDKIKEPEIPIKDGYKFIGWYNEEKLWDFNTIVTEDIFLYAKWEKIIYCTIVFEDFDGEIIGSVVIPQDSLLIDVPVVSHDGYDLEKDLVSNSMVLVARFNKIEK